MFESLISLRKKGMRREALPVGAKVMLSAALSAAVVFLAGTGACRAEEAPDEKKGKISSFAVAPYSEAAEDADLVYWWNADRNIEEGAKKRGRFMFLPSDTDPDSAKLYFNADATVAIDGCEVVSGQSASLLTEGKHTVTCGTRKYKLTVCMSANDPAVFINTASGTLEYLHELFPDEPEKENHEPALIRIYENGQLSVDKNLEYIKMRGNATKNHTVKKAYTIKFGKKTEVLGLGKAKKWVMLSSPWDPVLVHNDYGWELADAFGLKYNSDRSHVDLYINGYYRGNYVICDKVEVGSDRIDIRNLEKENERANPGIDLDELPTAGTGENGSLPDGEKDIDCAKWVELPEEPEDVSGSYLLEIQLTTRFDKEKAGFITSTKVPVMIREPENAGKREVEYVWTFVNEAFEALFSADGRNKQGKHYTDYIDMDSFVNMYILQELSFNLDAGQTSFYMILDNGKLLFSPLWDMDNAFSYGVTRFETTLDDPNSWWANSISNPEPTILTAAYLQDDFRKAVRIRWQQLLKQNVLENTAEKIRQIFEEQEASIQMNMIRYKGMYPNEVRRLVAEEYDKMQQFMQDRVEILTKGFSEQSAMLYYDANGGSGYVYNRQIVSQGETVILSDDVQEPNRILPPDESLHFAGWNTAPDGSGESYQAGDEMVLEKERSVLYAMWE